MNSDRSGNGRLRKNSDQLIEEIRNAKKITSRFTETWKLVCGYYNTGRPIVNGYASFCVNNKNYQKNWVYIKGV